MKQLERIKKETEFNRFNYPETGEFALAFNLKQVDFDWLVEQAEKADRHEKVLKKIAYGEIKGWSGSDVLEKVTDLAIETLKG